MDVKIIKEKYEKPFDEVYPKGSFKREVAEGKHDDTVVKDIMNVLAKHGVTYGGSFSIIGRVGNRLMKRMDDTTVEYVD